MTPGRQSQGITPALRSELFPLPLAPKMRTKGLHLFDQTRLQRP